MDLRVSAPELTYQYGKPPKISFEIKTNAKLAEKQFLEIKDFELIDLSAKKHSKRRSLDANAYMWLLLHNLAPKTGAPPETMYREYVRDIGGNCEIIPVRNDAVETWVKNWCDRGLGWICEVLRDSKIDGYTAVICYYGSSAYDTAQMYRLIQLVVEDCQENGIETKTPKEVEALMERWGKKHGS